MLLLHDDGASGNQGGGRLDRKGTAAHRGESDTLPIRAHPGPPMAPTTNRRRSAFDSLLDFLFPPVCIGCNERCEEPGFCNVCWCMVTAMPPAMCLRCGQPFHTPPDHSCQRCLATPPQFDLARSCSTYDRAYPDDPLARSLHRLKYNRDISFARPLAHLLAQRLPLADRHDAIVPVPLHIDRLRWRGFNQAVVLARPLAEKRNTPLIVDALRRVRATQSQVGLGEAERRRNIAGAFRLSNTWSPNELRVLLIDDVYTTGATVNECARVLRKAGASAVDVGVLARAR